MLRPASALTQTHTSSIVTLILVKKAEIGEARHMPDPALNAAQACADHQGDVPGLLLCPDFRSS